MCSVPTEVPAAERARWLAEISEALNDAHRVLGQLQLSEEDEAEARELHLRIQAARFEVQSLRLSRSLNPREESDPKWTEPAPWLPRQSASL